MSIAMPYVHLETGEAYSRYMIRVSNTQSFLMTLCADIVRKYYRPGKGIRLEPRSEK